LSSKAQRGIFGCDIKRCVLELLLLLAKEKAVGKNKTTVQQIWLGSAGIQAENTSLAHHSQICFSYDRQNLGLDA